MERISEDDAPKDTQASRADEAERRLRERADMLVLARRMLRPASCEGPLDEPDDSDEAAIEEALALCLDAYSKGSSCVRLSELASMAWPTDIDGGALIRVLEGHPEACACGHLGAAADAEGGFDAPLNLDGDLLYLTRCARMEARITQGVLERSGITLDGDPSAIGKMAASLMEIRKPDEDGKGFTKVGKLSAQQARAIAVAATHRLMVLTGGPGTGKTTVVVRVMAALDALHARAGGPPLEFRLAAPTGKAANRLKQSIEAGAASIAGAVTDEERDRLASFGGKASTLHSLLWSEGASPLESFNYDEGNELVGDVFIVDEVSMVSLSMLDAFLRAVPPRAKVILAGDPDQLASVDAGTVLSDLVHGLRARSAMLGEGDIARYAEVDASVREAWLGAQGGADEGWDGGLIRECAAGLVSLNRGHRSEEAGLNDLVKDIQQLSAGIGDATGIVEKIKAGSYGSAVHRLEGLAGAKAYASLIDCYRKAEDFAAKGETARALHELGSMTLLCANRNGPLGSVAWNERIARELAKDDDGSNDADEPPLDAFGERVGCPIMVTRNDHALALSNGDVGVLVRDLESGAYRACFDDPKAANGVRQVARAQIAQAEPAYAITIHKSQGSEYGSAVVQLAESAESPLNVRELLYTGVSRAKREVTIVGSEEALLRALQTPVRRASGLAGRLGA